MVKLKLLSTDLMYSRLHNNLCLIEWYWFGYNKGAGIRKDINLRLNLLNAL